ncbi:hypothetical protein OGAPHI_003056 [Ogataea philodendri]|uniref:Uncharacterized protein n=1 Tax=Ogataea philodendri TaxID=1378263 RepID=A0A9P8P9S9_9ASCO|nr:uncharacterized protein OGAPHI_003056 [Ogataea philodendri]KAH3667407.1 hypothetical protein OGAPHI_003056 [Ogataea philodendri]
MSSSFKIAGLLQNFSFNSVTSSFNVALIKNTCVLAFIPRNSFNFSRSSLNKLGRRAHKHLAALFDQLGLHLVAYRVVQVQNTDTAATKDRQLAQKLGHLVTQLLGRHQNQRLHAIGRLDRRHDNPVENQLVVGRILVQTEVSHTQSLEPDSLLAGLLVDAKLRVGERHVHWRLGLDLVETWLYDGILDDLLGIRVDVRQISFRVGRRVLRLEQLVVDSHLCDLHRRVSNRLLWGQSEVVLGDCVSIVRLVNVNGLGEWNSTGSKLRRSWLVRNFHQLLIIVGQVVNDHLQWVFDHHQSWSRVVQVRSHSSVESHGLDVGSRGGDSQSVDETQNGSWRNTSSSQRLQSVQSWIVPATNISLVHKLGNLSLGHDRSTQVQPTIFSLRWSINVQHVTQPLVTLSAEIELGGTQRMTDVLERIDQTVCEVVCWIDLPLVACSFVLGIQHTVRNQVPHLRRWRVDILFHSQSGLTWLFTIMALECPICRNPLGSGGNLVNTLPLVTFRCSFISSGHLCGFSPGLCKSPRNPSVNMFLSGSLALVSVLAFDGSFFFFSFFTTSLSSLGPRYSNANLSTVGLNIDGEAHFNSGKLRTLPRMLGTILYRFSKNSSFNDSMYFLMASSTSCSVTVIPTPDFSLISSLLKSDPADLTYL